MNLDSWLINLEKHGKDPQGDWQEHHKSVWKNLAAEIDVLLSLLASDLKLIVSDSKP
jgi:hypothetical protein